MSARGRVPVTTRSSHPTRKTRRSLTSDERDDPTSIPKGWRPFQLTSLTSGAFRENTTINYRFSGRGLPPRPECLLEDDRRGP